MVRYPSQKHIERAIALFDFVASEDSELSFSRYFLSEYRWRLLLVSCIDHFCRLCAEAMS